jgi:hypothetical protein
MAKVVRFHEFGRPEVLRLEKVTFKEPAPGELRLKVRCNRTQPAGGRLPLGCLARQSIIIVFNSKESESE